MIDAQDRELLEETVRSALADAEEGAAVDGILAELGWLDLLEDEPADAVEIVFAALGRSGARAAVLDDVVAAALGEKPRPELAVVLPRYGHWDPPGRIEGGELQAEGLATARSASARELLVVGGSAAEPRLVSLPLAAAERSPIRGVDPEAGYCAVRVSAGAAEAASPDSEAWPRAVALSRRAVAYQIAGGCRAVLEMARSHALEREQFGRPIAGFQAVRHRLAEALVAVEGLDAALSAAKDEGGPLTAALAKGVAGRTLRIVSGHCQQVLAGVGFTTEHAYHRFYKRMLGLEGLFGSADAIALHVGRELLAQRRVPRLIEL